MFSLGTIVRRLSQTSAPIRHHKLIRPASAKTLTTDANHVQVTFEKPGGKKATVKGKLNSTLYDVVTTNNVDIDGFGACEGTLCCTTCHLIFKKEDFEKVGPPGEEEMDMLELAYGLSETSRLGCQVRLRKDLEPLEVRVPPDINDARSL